MTSVEPGAAFAWMVWPLLTTLKACGFHSNRSGSSVALTAPERSIGDCSAPTPQVL